MKKLKFVMICTVLMYLNFILVQSAAPPKHPYASDKPIPVPVMFTIPGVMNAFNITFAPDGKTFYFLTDDNGMVIKYSRYENGDWSIPEAAGFSEKHHQEAPQISPDGAKLFFSKIIDDKTVEIWVAEKTGNGWSQPQNLGATINIQGVFQSSPSVAANGNLYFTSSREGGLKIFCAKWAEGQYAAPEILAGAINMYGVNDLFVAPDESFIILSVFIKNEPQLAISFKKNNIWTSPKIMGSEINSMPYKGRPCISPDGKYLFYTAGGGYETWRIYQVDWLPLLESLRKANSTPYLKTPLPDQTFAPGEKFSFLLDRNCFVDEDEGDVLTYKVKLVNGKDLPSWVTFDPEKLTFTGVSTEEKSLSIKVTATDKANAFVMCIFRLVIRSR